MRAYLAGLPGAQPLRVAEVVREVLAAAAQQTDFEEDPAVWLFAQGRRRIVTAGHRGDVLVTDEVEGGADEEMAAGEDPGIAVHRAFARLTVKQQEVLRLKFQFGFSLQELAGITGVSQGGAGGLLHSGVMRVCQASGAALTLGSEWTRNARLTAYALDEMEPAEKKAFVEGVPNGKALFESAETIKQTGVQLSRVLESGAPLPKRKHRRKGAAWQSPYAWLIGALVVAGAGAAWYFGRGESEAARRDDRSGMNGSFSTATRNRRSEGGDGSGRPGDRADSGGALAGHGRSLRPGEADWERKAFGQGRQRAAGEAGTTAADNPAQGRGETGPASDQGGARSAGAAGGSADNRAPAAENRGESGGTENGSSAGVAHGDEAAENDLGSGPTEASGNSSASASGKKSAGGNMKSAKPDASSQAKPVPGAGTEAGKAPPPPAPALGVAALGRALAEKRWPKPGEVRVAELVKRVPPEAQEEDGAVDDALAARVEMAPSPWQPEKMLVRVALKARPMPVPARAPANLVFAIDVSQSMAGPNRLPLVQEGIRLLAQRLHPADRVTVVTYAASAKELLPGTPLGGKALELRNALNGLEAAGQTNGYEGLQRAYAAARAGRVEAGLNVVVLCTDGNFNLGETDESVLAGIAAQAAAEGIKLSVFGFGRSDRNDLRLELLAAKGGGRSCYVNTREEAERLLATQIDGLIEAAANEVSLTVRFNPARVTESGRIDGGTEGATSVAVAELLPGRNLEALYEVTLDPAAAADRLVDLSVRYRLPGWPVAQQRMLRLEGETHNWAQTDPGFRFAVAWVELGRILHGERLRAGGELDRLEVWVRQYLPDDTGGYRSELLDNLAAARVAAEN